MKTINFTENEKEQLNDVVAKIIQLKDEGRLDDAIALCNSTLSEKFELEKSFLEEASTEQFAAELKARNYSEGHLEILIHLLFESAYPFQETRQCRAVMHKVAQLLKMAEANHNQLSLKHLNTREMVDHFLNNDQFE